MDIGDAKLKVTADTTAAEGKLRAFGNSAQQMSGQFTKMGIAVAAVGTAIVAALALSVKAVLELGDEIQKMSLRTGIAMENLSKLGYIAELSGFNLQTLDKGIKQMAKSLVQADDGLETYNREFERIGLNVKELMALSPEEAFWKIAEAVAAVENPMMRTQAATVIFGRAGYEMLPMLAQGSEGIRKMREDAEKFAPIIDEKLGNAMASLKDRLSEVSMGFKKVQISIASALLPYLEPLVEKIRDIIHAIADWMKEHPGLTKALVVLAGVVGVLMMAFGALLIALPTIIGPLAMLAGAGGIAGLTAAFAGLAAPLAGFIAAIAAIALPVIAAIAIIAALIFIGVQIAKNWDQIAATAKNVWGGIVDFFQTLPAIIGAIFAKIGDFMLAPIRNAVNKIIEAINWMVQQYNKLPWGDIKEIGWRFPKLAGGAIEMAAGGIVPGPIGKPVPIIAHGGEQFAGVGKRFGDTYITIQSEAFMGNEAEARSFAQTILDYIREDEARTTGVSA